MLGAFLAKVQQQSASVAQFHFPWYLFSIEEMSWWKCSPWSSLAAPQFSGKKSKCDERIVFLVTCCSLISGSSVKGCLQAPYSFEPFCFSKILYYRFKTVPSCFFVALKEFSNNSSLKISRICGPMKIPSFNFASLGLGNFSHKQVKAALLGSWPLQNVSSDQVLNAWMATKFY